MKKYEIELLAMEERDLLIREKLSRDQKPYQGYHPEMEIVHKENARRLREIIQLIGFPTISKVGEKASNAAWLIIQHAISEPAFMKNSYELMLQNADDIPLKNLAFLYDRIQFFEGSPQKYGTQLNSDGTIYPVEDKTKINGFRKENHLPPISQQEIDKILPVEAISLIENKNEAYVLWCKKIGWRE